MVSQTIAKIAELSALSDEQLAARARAGCAASFAALAQRMRPRLLHFLWQRTRSWADAEDAAQDALTKAMQKIQTYDDRWKFSTWLFTIGQRTAIDLRRKQRDTISIDATTPVPDRGAAPADRMAADELAANIWATAQRVLGDDQYSALWLRYGEDQEIRDIAKVLNKSHVAVRVMLMRARNKLAGHLEDERAAGGEPAATGLHTAPTGGVE